MSKLHTIIAKLNEFGLEPQQVLEIVEILSERTPAAERQARYRAKVKEQGITCDVTRDAPDLWKSVTCDVTRDAPPPSPSSSSPDGSPPAHRVIINTPLSLTPSSSPSSTPSLFRSSEAFGDFWKAYPRKVGKGAAERAWAKAIKHADADQIIEAVRAADWSADPEFIPHPSTWLNGKRWMDEKPARRLTLAEELAQRARDADTSNVFDLIAIGGRRA